MKVWYNVEIQMLGENERYPALDEEIGNALDFVGHDIDERELYSLTALYTSTRKPTEMRKRIRDFLDGHPEIYYIDVIYRWDSENVPDRFVIWQDGRTQEYTGEIVFKEDK